MTASKNKMLKLFPSQNYFYILDLSWVTKSFSA